MINPSYPLSLLLCFAALCDISFATNVLPRGEYAPLYRAAFDELHDVIIKGRGDHNLVIRGAVPLPRKFYSANRSEKRSADGSAAALEIRDILFGKRQSTCSAGYSLCNASGRCCPNRNGKARCCDDGTCTDGTELCCDNGGTCPGTRDCCEDGCMPKGNVCCKDNWNCDPGFFCCGNQNCAPKGGECCKGRQSCDAGLRCVTLNGVQGCCKDLSCSEFDSSGPSDFSISRISIPSFNTRSLTAFPSFTLPSFSRPVGSYTYRYSYYTTTFTFYYYSYFLTLQTPTSTRVTTSTTISVYASGSAAARSEFNNLSSDLAPLTAITAPGFTDSTARATGTASSAAGGASGGGPTGGAMAGGGGSGGSGSGGASGGPRTAGTPILLGLWCLLAGAVGAIMILL